MTGEQEASINRLERHLTDMRVEVASGFATLTANLEAMRSHEQRLRELENRQGKQITLEDVKEVVADAIAASRRPSWRDVGALVAAISTSVMLVLGVLAAVSQG